MVSRLAFGAMTFGSGNIPAVYKVGEAQASRLVDRALDAGMNFFDTADAYADGASESMLGKILAARRPHVVVATKVGIRTGPGLLDTGLSRRRVLAACDASLSRLATDYIDLYIVHRFDPHTPVEETLGALDDLVRAGKVRYVGFSNWSAWQAAKAVGIQERNGYARFAGAQLYYSLVGRDAEHELMPFAEDAGIGTMIWSPLAGGFLSGKYTRENLTQADNRLSGFDFLPFDKEQGFALVELMRSIASERGASVSRVAIAWLLRKRGVTSVLVGVSKESQLEDNLGAVSLRLTDDEMARLDDTSPSAAYYPTWFNQRLLDSQLELALAT